jgi:hypothetical protein
MSIKNFKSFKNYQKKSPRPPTIEVLGKERPKLKFDQSKIKPALIKALPALCGLIIGYVVIDLPGMIIGAIVGHQLAKLYIKFFGKKHKKSFR